ncbi:MAG: DUF2779 domain-containing protein [Micavibrio sp.]
MKPEQGLSKSQFIMGKQCPKALWFYRHPYALRQGLNAGFNAAAAPGNPTAINIGHDIGALAKRAFPGGVEIANAYNDTDGAARATKDVIAAGQDVIFEATAINPLDGTYAKLDILRRVPGTNANAPEWEMIEVKASLSVKDYHRDDLAFQYHVFTAAGFKIRSASLMLVDRDYLRRGALDPARLFKTIDLTAEIEAKQLEIVAAIAALKAIPSQRKKPDVKIGAHCSAPLDCRYKFNCWAGVPQYSVFDVFPRGNDAEKIAAQTGSYDVKDIPAALLPTQAERQIELSAHLAGKAHVDAGKLRAFTATLQYPLYFLDYETINPAAPAYDGTAPYQQIPFQFSLHVKNSPRAKLHHHQFLHKATSDPREDFIRSLITSCGKSGSVVVYNQAFEDQRTRELAKAFPAYAKDLDAIRARMVDLYQPFKNRWLYHPAQNGSASIKAVLPAFTRLGYDGLAIGNGADASQLYLSFVTGQMPPAEQARLWPALEKYCGLDTFAMVKLLEVVKKKAAALPVPPPAIAP